MANRVIRDWTTSEAMNKLSSGAENFFTRLIMKADDYGSFYANPKLLKAALFPLKDISDSTIQEMVNECLQAKLAIRYSVEGKEYIRIKNFGQRLRNMRNAFPHPSDNSRQLAATRGEVRLETKRNEEETEVEEETNCAHGIENSDFKYDVPVPREATDLIEAICDYFEVKKILTSKIYNSIDDFVRTAMHRNELTIVSLALQKYMAYKARSQEAKHNVLNWIGTKDNHYSDGHWNTTDWSLKLKNSNNHAPTERKTTAASAIVQPGKRFR